MNANKNPLELHLKNAKLTDIDSQAADLKEMYQIYKTLKKVTNKPGDISLNYEFRTAGKTSSKGKSITTEKIKSEAARFRILEAIKQHVISNVGDIQSFDLAFDLSCREIPELDSPQFLAEVAGSKI